MYRQLSKKRQEERSTTATASKRTPSVTYPSYSESSSKVRQSDQDESYRKAGWGSSSQSPNSSTSRNTKDSRLKHYATMPPSRSSRTEPHFNPIGSTNTGTTNDYGSHHHYDRHRHYSGSGNNNQRRSYHDSMNESPSDYRSHYNRDRDR